MDKNAFIPAEQFFFASRSRKIAKNSDISTNCQKKKKCEQLDGDKVQAS